LGELYYGALKLVRIDDNLKRVNDFATDCTILTCDAETAEEYGRIKAGFRERAKWFRKMIFGLQRSPGNMI
jgi:tRNA(fMet)-specific endonuclease VapC